MIRRMSPEQAIETLKFVNRAAAQDLAKAIKTSLANAGQGKELVFKKIEINEGLKFKRVRIGSRTYLNPYKRRMSHIKIVLTDGVTGKKEAIEQQKGGLDDSAVATAKTEEVISESSKS